MVFNRPPSISTSVCNIKNILTSCHDLISNTCERTPLGMWPTSLSTFCWSSLCLSSSTILLCSSSSFFLISSWWQGDSHTNTTHNMPSISRETHSLHNPWLTDQRERSESLDSSMCSNPPPSAPGPSPSSCSLSSPPSRPAPLSCAPHVLESNKSEAEIINRTSF